MKTIQAILLFLLFASLQLLSQDKKQTVLHGKLLNESNNPIQFAHITIQNTPKGTISNIHGEFEIKLNQNDVVLISCLGYRSKSISFPEELPEKVFKVFYLNTDTVKLSETTVRPWPATYRKLKEKIQDMELEDKYTFNTQDQFLNKEMQTASKLALRNYGEHPVGISGPFSLVYNAFGNKPRQFRQLPKQTTQARKEEVIKSKFNIEIIKKVTKMNDQDSIKQFLDFCNYDETYLVNVDEYDLILDLQEKFKRYKLNLSIE